MLTTIPLVERILDALNDVVELELDVGQMRGQLALRFVARNLCSLLPLRGLF